MKDDFYIGYIDRIPKGHGSLIKMGVVAVFILTGIIAFCLVKTQKGFSSGTFELGKITEMEGFLTIKPVPMLTTLDGKESILLVDYGKFGAEKSLLSIFRNDLNATYKATVAGTLIYNDGKALMELTKKEKSILSFEKEESKSTIIDKGNVVFQGEIVDPKCYFGVMKAGQGKTHRSCAIRCISGGIPPVFKVVNGGNETQYFILRGQNGQQINEMVLDYVADQVKISGALSQFNNWFIINIDESIGIQRLN